MISFKTCYHFSKDNVCSNTQQNNISKRINATSTLEDPDILLYRGSSLQTNMLYYYHTILSIEREEYVYKLNVFNLLIGNKYKYSLRKIT